MKSVEIYDLIVIGGGPAGMMAAGRAAERARLDKRSLKVLLVEKNSGLGRKLLLTGGGRCNLTNAEPDERVLLAKFKEAAKFLFSTFSKYGVRETLDFFNGRGMETKVEAGNRVFPLSDRSQSVWDVLHKYLLEEKVIVRTDAAVTGFVTNSTGAIEAIKLKGGALIRGRAFVLATGGQSHPETGSTGDGFAWLRQLGHEVITPSAALVPITVSDLWVKKLSGIALPQAKLTIFLDGVKQETGRGKLLLTHFGLSGPLALNLSSTLSELLKYGQVIISLDLLPEEDYSSLNDKLQELLAVEHKKKIKNALSRLIGSGFVPVVLEQAHIDGETFCHSLSREARLRLVKDLKALLIHPTGLLGTDKAIVTSGGVALEEVDFRTMRSRLIPNLYLVGDILNIDRPSGGYSLQLCWTTGWVAGESVVI